MKRVLIPLDGTRNAEGAIATVAELCTPGDEIILLSVARPEAPRRAGYRPGPLVSESVVSPAGVIASAATPDRPYYTETTEQALQRVTDEANDYLEGLAAELRRRGHFVETEVLVSDKADEAIIDFARRVHPTFIAMLRRTHLGVGEIIFGSVASSVMKADVAPVLVVPAGHSPRTA